MVRKFALLFFAALTVFFLFAQAKEALSLEDELSSLRDELKSAVGGKIRPLTGLQIERAREEGIEAAPLGSLIAEQPSIQSNPRPSVGGSVPSRPTLPPRPTLPSSPGSGERPGFRSEQEELTRDFSEEELKAVVIPTNLKNLNLPPDVHKPGVVPRYEADVDGAKNLSGNLIYGNYMTARDVTFNSVANLNLTLVNSTIVLGDEDTAVVRNQHTINVIGSNKIEISRKLTVDGDGVNSGIFLAREATLTFEFKKDGFTTPELYLSPNFVMNLPPNSRLIFSGEGIVRVGDGCVLNLMGERERKIVNRQEVITIKNRPTIEVRDSAALTLVENAVALIKGIGIFNIWHGGSLLLDLPSQLITGNQTTDDFIINITYSGFINLSSSKTTPAIFSIAYATTEILMERSGAIEVGNGGIFEINLIADQISRGILKKWSIPLGCALGVDGTGRLKVASNIYNPKDVKPNGKVRENYIEWLASFGSFKGFGLIEYRGESPAGWPDRNFTGRFQSANAAYNNLTEELEELVKNLVKTSTDAAGTIQFIGADGLTYQRTSYTDETILVS